MGGAIRSTDMMLGGGCNMWIDSFSGNVVTLDTLFKILIY